MPGIFFPFLYLKIPVSPEGITPNSHDSRSLALEHVSSFLFMFMFRPCQFVLSLPTKNHRGVCLLYLTPFFSFMMKALVSVSPWPMTDNHYALLST